MAHRVLQVGVGGFGKGWTNVLSKSGDVEIVGAVDTSREALHACREKHGLAENICHVSLDEALAEIRPEIVVCVTPPEAHREVCEAALASGAHVITEKPMATSMDDAHAMADAEKRAGKRLAVSQNYRFGREARTAQDVIRSGRVGEPASFAVRFFRGPAFKGSFRRRMPYPLVADMSIHHYDLMRSIIGRDPVWTFARSFNPPWSWYDGDASVSQVIGFQGDLVGTYVGSWCSRGAEDPWPAVWRIECSEGVVVWDGSGVHIGAGGEELEDVPPVELESESQPAVLADFLAAIEEDRAPETDAADNLKSLAMVFKTIEASETGGVVNF